MLPAFGLHSCDDSRIRDNAVSKASQGLDRESTREAEGLTDVWFRRVLGVAVQKRTGIDKHCHPDGYIPCGAGPG